VVRADYEEVHGQGTWRLFESIDFLTEKLQNSSNPEAVGAEARADSLGGSATVARRGGRHQEVTALIGERAWDVLATPG
jgi:hypothetical protein